jgi:hypothetical protein
VIDPDLTFQADGHIYRYRGRVVPSVSDIIAAARDFAGIPPDVLQAASERGSDVHLACELDDKGVLDEETVSATVRPYLEAWRKFTREHQPTWTFIEEPMYHRLMSYAGTPDRVGFIDDDFYVPDIKTVVQMHPAFGLQGDGYANLVEAHEGIRPKRLGIQLKPDGNYALHPYTDPLDRVVFQSMVTVRNWRMKHA